MTPPPGARPGRPDPRTPTGTRRRAPSIADTVVEAVERHIGDQRLPAGHRLGTKDDLCAKYGVAPATLGEALRVLRGRAVVEVRPGPGGGIFVAERSPLIALAHNVLQLRRNGATVNDMVGVLDALDGAVVDDAVRHRTPEDVTDLDRLMAELRAAWPDPQARPAATWALHRRIAQISPNVVLRTFYLDLSDYIEGESPATAGNPFAGTAFRPDSDDRLAVHQAIIDAIRAADPELGRQAIARHRASPET